MHRFESFMILVNNLSDVYIFTVVTMFSVAAVALYCAKIMNKNLVANDSSGNEMAKKNRSKKKDKNSDTEEEDIDARYSRDDYHESDEYEGSSRDFVREIKTAKLKEIEESLTDEQIQEERRVESQQLAAIYDLLKKQEEEFNTSGIDESEFKKQLRLYR